MSDKESLRANAYAIDYLDPAVVYSKKVMDPALRAMEFVVQDLTSFIGLAQTEISSHNNCCG